MQLRLLEAPDLTYDTAVQKCRSNEATKEQQVTMSKTVNVNELKGDTQYRKSNHVAERNSNNNNSSGNSNNNSQSNRNSKPNTSGYKKRGNNTHKRQTYTQNRSQNNNASSVNNTEKLISDCRNCGYTHKIRECPAYGKVCGSCSKPNHFSKMCRFKNVNSIRAFNNSFCSDYSDNDELYIGSIESGPAKVTDDSVVYPWLETVVVEEKNVPFKIDTGAEIDVIPVSVLKRLDRRIKVRKTGTKLRAFGGQRIIPIGMCFLSCKFGNKFVNARIAVVDFDITPILGLNTCVNLGIVTPSKRKHNRKHL